MIAFASSPVSSVCAAAADAFFRAAGIVPRKGFNFVDAEQAQLAIEYESGKLLAAGKIQSCAEQGCCRFFKSTKKPNATCHDCKEVNEYWGVRPVKGRWVSTVWVHSQGCNHYVGTFDTAVEGAAAADAYIRANGIEGATLSFESAEAAAEAVAAATAA